MTAIARFRTTVIDCPDPLGLARFYAAVLDWPVSVADDTWVVVSDGGPPARLAFQRADDYVAPAWPDPKRPQQFHLDLTVEDLDEGEAQVLRLGATKPGHQPSDDGSFRVFLDPAGHPFCLCVGEPTS
ncbi:VOC family protein [Nonomuraea sp. NBC_01738]|uniref:VOC family protein n=1 Tax=Nonomuraea sp. NBC_01738 TaxID=2976003 RepID=UPI002E132783|nr:VOC family protein [Nonomuraea sp. NBC_01738]